MWAHPPDVPVPEAGCLDVWRIDTVDVSIDGAASLLSTGERERADAFVSSARHDDYIASHGALRTVLGRYVGVAPRSLAFSEGAGGKPELSGTSLSFSLSRTSGLSLLAVASDRRVGVDIERIRALSDMASVVGRFFSAEEQAEFASAAADHVSSMFFRIWTRKEAFAKATGRGLRIPLEHVSVPTHGVRGQVVVSDRDEGAIGRVWTVEGLDVGERYAGAVAADGASWDVRLFDATDYMEP